MPSFDPEGLPTGMTEGDPDCLFKSLALMLQDGVLLEQALPAFTSNVAALSRLPHKGSIAVGAHADLVVLDESNRIADVMARGRWHVVDRQPVVFGTFEQE
jgi:beta-aspartyl-dipeptidase (metallo-type)